MNFVVELFQANELIAKKNIEGNERNLKFRVESISWEILFTVKGVG